MKQQLAVNSKHTGNYSKDNRGYAETWTSEQIDHLLSEDWLRQTVAEIRGGNEKQKDQLPFICPHYSAFRDNHRAQADIIPESFTYMTCVDVDELSKVDKAIKRALELNAEDGGDWQNMVLRIAYSARKKVHIYIRMPIGKTIAEAQQMFCAELEDVPFDESCITPERFIYITGIDEEVFRSEHWLESIPEEELEERREAFLNRGLDVDGRPLKTAAATTKSESETDNTTLECTPADECTMFIFKECMKEEEVTEADLINEGHRHNSVKMILNHCNQLLSKQETLGVLKELMPANWQDKNIQDLVTAYYTEYYNPQQRLTQFQKRVFRDSKRIGRHNDDSDSQQCTSNQPAAEMQSELSRLFASATPPELPTVLPKLVKAVTRNTPNKYKATVAQAMFPPLGAYPKNLSFVYIDNQIRELRINCLIVAKTGSGKDSCTRQPLEHLIAIMKERDKTNRQRLKEFNDDYNSKAGNKQKPKRPDDLVIQNIKSNITFAALVQRTDEANGAPLYVRINELEQWDKIEGATGRNNQFTTLKLCDDEGNDFGADRASTQSVTGDGCLYLNWNANTTIPKVIRYFRYVMTDGPISRLTLATIPEEERGADIAVFGDYDEAYDAALKPYIDNLKNATGKIDCPQAKRLARQLKDECAEFARLSQDDVFDNLSHRALVMAFRKACLIYVANGKKWEKSIETFCRWSLFYDLYLKMTLFGDLIRKADEDVPTTKRGPRSLLELLPDEFTLEDAKRVRQQEGLDNEDRKCEKMIYQWAFRKYVLQITDYSYKKSKSYVAKRNKKQQSA